MPARGRQRLLALVRALKLVRGLLGGTLPRANAILQLVALTATAPPERAELLLQLGEKGKLHKLGDALEGLQELELVTDDVDVTVILYAASEQARDHIEATLPASALPAWEIRVVQTLPSWTRVDRCDSAMAEVAERFYDEVLTDEHKGSAPLSYADCALPLVLAAARPLRSRPACACAGDASVLRRVFPTPLPSLARSWSRAPCSSCCRGH